MKKRIKVLLLGYHDSSLTGHIRYEYNHLPDNVEGVMITLTGTKKKTSYNYYKQNSIPSKLHHFLRIIWRAFYSVVCLHCFPIVDKNHKEYGYFNFEFYPYSAKKILKKCPVGFMPDAIVVYWDNGFVSTNLINELYQITKAKIIYRFIDEAPMTGGCHYPIDCVEYLDKCANCPALSKGKKLSQLQLERKQKNLNGLPLYIAGTPYDIKLAKKTRIFEDAIELPSVRKPEVKRFTKEDARSFFKLDNNNFVVLVSASSFSDVRKGFLYSKKALSLASEHIPNLIVLAAGKNILEIDGVKVHNIGFVDMNTLFIAYSAADCFLSTTIGDSGPMMVNYSFALGVPVVSFPIGVADSLIEHKKTGYRAKYKDADDITRALVYISSLSKEERELMSKSCISKINELSIDGSWYDQLLNLL